MINVGNCDCRPGVAGNRESWRRSDPNDRKIDDLRRKAGGFPRIAFTGTAPDGSTEEMYQNFLSGENLIREM